MTSNAVWRIQLKPDKQSAITYRDLLEFCKKEQVIGVGWQAITMRCEDENRIYEACKKAYPNGVNGAYKAIHAVSQIQEGDLMWTRLGGDASEYYLFRAGSKLWKDIVLSADDQQKYDLSNVVTADWVYVGKQKDVPGKVVNSFAASATIQRVNDVNLISMDIWNRLCQNDAIKYPEVRLTQTDFWTWISSDELECLVLLYLQSRGYYIYSSSAKVSNPKYEAVMVYKDGSHFAYPQVKRSEQLLSKYYADGIDSYDKVFLFTTSEDYGEEKLPNVECITRSELEMFMRENSHILTITVRNLLSKVGKGCNE